MTTRALQPLKNEVNRRDFLKALGGGLLVFLSPVSTLAQESGRGIRGHELPTEIGAWIHIDADGHVKVFTGKVEVGQNIRTSLAQAVAEELRVPFDSITMIMGDTDLVPWDMGTFGSRTTPTMSRQLRRMAAAARELLVETAAQRWNIDRSNLVVNSGRITMPDGKKGAYLRAYDKKTGADAGAVPMPAGQTGSPMTYMLNGKQYIVVAVGAAGFPAEYLAYRLPN